MKTIPPDLQAHLQGGVTTLCYCWRLTRRDGVVFGFTEHDRDVVAEGTTFLASTGFTASQIAQGLGLSVDNLEASGALSSAGITDADILAGRYGRCGGRAVLGQLGGSDPDDPADPGQPRRDPARGRRLRGRAAVARPPARPDDRPELRAYLFGDARRRPLRGRSRPQRLPGLGHCGQRDHDSPARGAGPPGFASDWFTGGRLTLDTGGNAAIAFEVKAHRRTAGVDILELWLPPPFPIAAGDAGRVVAGCRKTLATCISKFDNVANFRGFPHIPGVDAVTRYGVQGALAQTGGSIFGSR